MSIKNAYLNGVYEDLAARYAEQTEFLEIGRASCRERV